MKKKYLTIIMCLFFVMKMQAQNYNRMAQIGLQIETDTVLHPFDGNPTTSIGISGQVTFTSELGFVRFVVSDNYDDEYMIYESYRLFESDSTFSFSQKCDESCFFDSYTPTELIVQIHDAIVTITAVNLSNIQYSNAEHQRINAAAVANENRLMSVQNYISREKLIWRADHTSTSNLSYSSKSKLWGKGFGSYGYEYYSGGIYTPPMQKNSPFDTYEANYGFAHDYDWRNRHDANNPLSPYYDGDPLGTGWITPVVCQSNGCWLNNEYVCNIDSITCVDILGGEYREAATCWIFGPTSTIEAMTNLYYNEHVDVDLSEQYIACQRQSIAHGHASWAFNYFVNEGVPDENCLIYSASLNDCSNLCNNPEERIAIDGFDYHSIYNAQNSYSFENLRQNLVNHGPLTVCGIPYPWYQPGTTYETHCMTLVGWGTIDEDTPKVIGVDDEIDPVWYGITYWIYKDSNGLADGHNGFKYIIHPKDVPPRDYYVINTPITSLNRTDADINCYDHDGDGYYFWGIGPKPPHCPPCPDEPDGNDNNAVFGLVHNSGQCTIIDTYNNSFENKEQIDYWVYLNADNQDSDWQIVEGQIPFENFGPTQAQEGTYYLYTNSRYGNYPKKHHTIEASIDFSNYCAGIIEFYYYMDYYHWGNDDNILRIELQVSYDKGQTWIPNYWYSSNEHCSEWNYQCVMISSSVNKIRFVGTTGKSQYNVLAIDNITIVPVKFNNTNLVIESSVVWNSDKVVNQTVIIENGGVLLFKDHLFSIHPEAKIIVKPGGRLVIDGGKLTSSCPNSMWPGIEVWGNSAAHQYPVNGHYAQGYVELKNGATIENAECALALWRPNHWSTTGGIVHAENATFRNCAKAVHALHYANHHPATGKETAYNSRFRNCTFAIDNGYLGTTAFHKHADLNHVDGISFIGCDFSADRTAANVSPWCIGIAAYTSGFKATSFCDYNGSNSGIHPCPDELVKGCSFSGFHEGIFANNDGSAARTFLVSNGSFRNNRYGIHALNTGFATILHSDFVVGSGNECAFGIHADHVAGFCIEENSFRAQHNGTGDTYGIAISDSHGTNDIYRNTFSGLACGNLAVGTNIADGLPVENRRTMTGLTYTCNENEGNGIDFCVLDGGAHPSGIQEHQGSLSLPAGNTFSGRLYHFYNEGDDLLTYYYFNGGQPGQEPAGGLLYRVTHEPSPNANDCPSHYGNGGPVLSEEERAAACDSYFLSHTAYESLERVYGNRLDGGNTAAQTAHIEAATPADMWQLRTQLLSRSPYLSQEVLTAAADRDDVFPEMAQFEILAANPDELKKDTLIRYLENKDNPLPPHMTDLLRVLAEGTTDRTVLMAQMGRMGRDFSLAAADIVRSNLNDSLADPDELRTWLANMECLDADRLAVASLVQEGDFSNALALAGSLPQLYGMQDGSLDEHDDYMLLLGLYQSLHDSNRNASELDAAEVETVEGIAEQGRGAAKAMAKSLLRGLSDDRVPSIDCPRLPDAGNGGRGGTKPVDASLLGMAMGLDASVRPNPATSWAVIDYTLPLGATKATLTFTNALGVAVMTAELNGSQGQKVLDLRPLAAGVYGYDVRCGEYVLNGKMVVTK